MVLAADRWMRARLFQTQVRKSGMNGWKDDRNSWDCGLREQGFMEWVFAAA